MRELSRHPTGLWRLKWSLKAVSFMIHILFSFYILMYSLMYFCVLQIYQNIYWKFAWSTWTSVTFSLGIIWFWSFENSSTTGRRPIISIWLLQWSMTLRGEHLHTCSVLLSTLIDALYPLYSITSWNPPCIVLYRDSIGLSQLYSPSCNLDKHSLWEEGCFSRGFSSLSFTVVGESNGISSSPSL